MALARKRALLMFFTSVLMPNGSPGICTDTLASTLSWPSVGGEREEEIKSNCGKQWQTNTDICWLTIHCT